MKANLSIIVNCYQKPREQIEECIQSIKDQTVQPGEIIFVDDHSDSPYVPGDCLSIILPKNMGVAYARNIGVRMSTSKLLLFVDADDKLAPDFIQQCGKHILKADIVYPNILYFGNVERNKLYPAPSRVTPKYLLGKSIDLVVTSMMWRKVYDKLQGFKDLPVFEDWDFWLRAMANGYIFKRANTILWYRQGHGSRNHQSLDLKFDIHAKITAQWKEQEGKLVWVQNGIK
jgi:glycosyltransferase involved in cell wall biosynthesis